MSLCLQIGKYVEVAATSANTLCPNCQQGSMCSLLASESRHLQSFCTYFLAGKVFCILYAIHWDWNGEIVIQSVPSPVGRSACKDLLCLIDPSQGHRFSLNAFSPSFYPIIWRSFLQFFFFFCIWDLLPFSSFLWELSHVLIYFWCGSGIGKLHILLLHLINLPLPHLHF